MRLDNRGGHQWNKEHSEVVEQALRKCGREFQGKRRASVKNPGLEYTRCV